MANNCDAHWALYKKMKSLFPMPEDGKGYCVEVLPDGSFNKIDFLDLEDRNEVLFNLRKDDRPHAIYCSLQEPFRGFSSRYLLLEENAQTGELELFSDHFIQNPDPAQARIEMFKLIEMLRNKEHPKISSC